jgi:hypothetical protein
MRPFLRGDKSSGGDERPECRSINTTEEASLVPLSGIGPLSSAKIARARKITAYQRFDTIA